MTKITFVRHGTTEWMEQGLLHGQLDSPLSSLGIRQVEEAAYSLQSQTFDAFFCSSSGRAVQSANIIKDVIHMPFKTLDGLMEKHFGAREGRPFPIRSPYRKGLIALIDRMLGRANKSGETQGEFETRVVGCIDFIRVTHPQKRVLIVTHYGVINTVLQRERRKRAFSSPIKPAEIIEVELSTN